MCKSVTKQLGNNVCHLGDILIINENQCINGFKHWNEAKATVEGMRPVLEMGAVTSLNKQQKNIFTRR